MKLLQNPEGYAAPWTERVLVAVESCMCATSGETITEDIKMNVEVDDWTTVENDITFD